MKEFLVILLSFLSVAVFAQVEKTYRFRINSQKNIFIKTIERDLLIEIKSFHIEDLSRPQINAFEKKILKFNYFNSHRNSPNELRILEFILNLPEDELLTYYEAPLNFFKQEASWNSICHKLDLLHEGFFIAEDKKYIFQKMVGQVKSRCYGRCGSQCGLNNDGTGSYTQECFNHDLCHRLWGTQLGECKEEYWAAVSGFLNAPSCK